MSEELMQWLAEIRTLRQQLAQVERDRNAAQESATHWRKLYNIEARQRRTEAQLAADDLQQVTEQLHQLQGTLTPENVNQNGIEAAIEAELVSLQTQEDYKRKLIEVIQERDRALEALKQEQENHIETRRNLTAVIGDTIDQLNRLRQGK
ncbi:hypothetical protein PN462_20525 [Spirulina sp. CS-785/01]|uniref:hypothetical protein n=1 Tax=Spirulina sp. CS-785/01 TaxID=3021716 RepID=UPI0023305768|nr:hypothetical protein [Spirulina sp. CS-785/01]MDB9315511.1 hypothetical protein [Spirulina sp. CS-785/01]